MSVSYSSILGVGRVFRPHDEGYDRLAELLDDETWYDTLGLEDGCVTVENTKYDVDCYFDELVTTVSDYDSKPDIWVGWNWYDEAIDLEDISDLVEDGKKVYWRLMEVVFGLNEEHHWAPQPQLCHFICIH